MQEKLCGRWWAALLLLAAANLSAATGRELPLIEAVKQGDPAVVGALVEQGADVNAPEVDGTTALHWAVHRDGVELVDLLLRAGAKVGAVNRYGVAPLSLACRNGHAAIVERLLRAGADPNTAQPGGETALMTAARTGRSDVVRLLLAHGADVNAKERAKGQTALMWAAAENNAAVVEALIALGADIQARSNLTAPPKQKPTNMQQVAGDPPGKGFTALLFAARAGAIEAARTLIAAGANVNDTLPDGTSGLVLAVVAAKFDMAAFLLDQGADPNAAGQGWTALHSLAYTRRPNRGGNVVGQVPRGQVDSLTVARKLVARGANVNARMTKKMNGVQTGRIKLNQLGTTPFFLAAHRVDLEYMRLLVELGADPLIPSQEGTTPLMAAAGVQLWYPGESPGTPQEVTETVRFCLQLGCGDPTAVDALGDTALHGASYWDSPGAIELLVAAGAKLDVTNKLGWTPVRIADGVAVTASLHVSVDSGPLLRRLMAEQGLPVPAPITGDAGCERAGAEGCVTPPERR